MLVAALSECLPSSQYKPYTPEGSVMLLIIHLVFSIDVSHKVYTVGANELIKTIHQSSDSKLFHNHIGNQLL